MKELESTILIFTDGACSGNPGRGGFGAVIAYPEGKIEEIGEGRSATTNNRMEMMGVIRALERISDRPENVWVLTDSTYVIRGITQWIWGWKKKNWVTAEGEPVSNQDIWEVLDQLVAKRKKKSKIDWKYVRGHTGVPGNERCDEISVGFTKGEKVILYSGSVLNYPFPIYDIPEDTSLPEMKPKKEKTAAYSYLSLVNGELKRHMTWKECEVAVKGRSGAKFKKAESQADEAKIVTSWGYRPDQIK